MPRERRLTEYYKTGQYRDFFKKKKHRLKISRGVRLTFSNGQDQISASGMFTEQALEEIFDKIDAYLDDSDREEISRDPVLSTSTIM